MANKRMFCKDIVCSDAFLNMPISSQNLYFQLGMEVDDDGFVGNPKKIMRTIGANEDDLKILISKRFVLLFPSSVLVVKHHRLNNNWDKYNCKRTVYTEEFKQLYIKENQGYTLDSQQGNLLQSANSLKTVSRIEENRRDKKRIDKNTIGDELPEWLDKKAWAEWEQHRKEKRQKLTPLSIKKQLTTLEAHKDDHVKIIERSIANGWTGLFPEKVNQGRGKSFSIIK